MEYQVEKKMEDVWQHSFTYSKTTQAASSSLCGMLQVTIASIVAMALLTPPPTL